MSNGIKIAGFLSHGNTESQSIMLNGAQNGLDSTRTVFNMLNGSNEITSINDTSGIEEGQILILSSNIKTRLISNNGNIRLSTNQYTMNTNDTISLICDGTNWLELYRSVAPVKCSFGGGANTSSTQYLNAESFGMHNFGARTRYFCGRNGHIEKIEFIIGSTTPTGNLEIRIGNVVQYTITATDFINNSVTNNTDILGSIDLPNIAISTGEDISIKCDNATYNHITCNLFVT